MAKSSSQSLVTVERLDERMGNMIDLFERFMQDYKETTKEIIRKQDEQFAVVMKRITDIETWKATETPPSQILQWNTAAKRVDDYLDEHSVNRRERVLKAVEAHMDDNGKIESLFWLSKTRDRWGFLLTVIGTVLGLVSGLFYWLLDHIIFPWIQSK